MKKIISALILIFIFGLVQCKSFAQDQDIYFIAYVNRLETKIKSNWIIPPGKIDKKAVLVFDVDKNGGISNISLSTPSGDKEFDDTALAAVSESSPFEAFPANVENNTIKIKFTFNEDDIEASPILEQSNTLVLKQNIVQDYAISTTKPDEPIVLRKNKVKKIKTKKPHKMHLYESPNSFNAGTKPKTVAAAAVSLLIWPGLGQLMNNAPSEKIQAHAILGVIYFFRLWSCYDAFVDRKGGVWDGRI